MKHWVLFLICAVQLPALQNSDKFSEGRFAGFTKSPTEHIIQEIGKPFKVRSVVGTISLNDPDQPFPNVLFELRGPNDQKRFRQTASDLHGRFALRDIPQGTYEFKATRNGFQSVFGTIVVSDKAKKNNTISISMHVGI